MSIADSECVCVALVIQHAERMGHIILSSISFPAVQNLSTLFHKMRDFRDNLIAHKTCVLIFYTSFV
jgi:hypothetical protein